VSVGVWCLAAALGGGGAVLRFLLDDVISRRLGSGFPYGTLTVNLSGALLLGLMVGLALRGSASVLVEAAAIGAYTTFSTWMFESQRLTEDGESGRAFTNLVLSVLIGVLAAAAGRSLGAHL